MTAANGTATNGATTKPVVVAPVPREPVGVIEAWIGAEMRRAKPDRFDLLQRSERFPDGRLVASWGPGDASSSRELAQLIYDCAVHETAAGFEVQATYELSAEPSKRYLTLDVPVRSRALTHANGVEGAIALVLDQLRRDQEHKEKFIASSISMTAEIVALNTKSFTDRDKQSTNLITALTKGFESQIEALTKMVSKLMDERVSMVDQWMKWSTDNAANEREAAREASRTKMKEEVFSSVLKPILPTLMSKFLAGAKAAMGEKAGAEKPAEKAEKTETAETKPATEKAVTEKQATALRALFSKLEESDFAAMAAALEPEKRLLFLNVAESFMEGAT